MGVGRDEGHYVSLTWLVTNLFDPNRDGLLPQLQVGQKMVSSRTILTVQSV